MTDQPAETEQYEAREIVCPKCKHANWHCYDETTRDCWDPDGNQVGLLVYGALVCDTCSYAWLDVQGGCDCDGCDCECEEY